jgi:threonine aldolase
MDTIDLRSDTVTEPTPAMREAMLRADVGDDVYGEDPTVNALQERLAADLGFEAGLFAPSGTQANLVGLLSHCQRGDEYIVGMDAHTYKFEGGGAAVFGSIQPQPLPQDDDGTMSLAAIEAAIKPVDPHFARTKILCLEDTWNGRALPHAYLRDARALCDRRGLGLHLDGARLFNAAVADGVPAREIAQALRQRVGVPVERPRRPRGFGAVGTRALIDDARRWRKVAGGGMRQAGLLAAACMHALDHHVERLADDHRRAAQLADGLQGLEHVTVAAQHTNMVFIDVPKDASTPSASTWTPPASACRSATCRASAWSRTWTSTDAAIAAHPSRSPRVQGVIGTASRATTSGGVPQPRVPRALPCSNRADLPLEIRERRAVPQGRSNPFACLPPSPFQQKCLHAPVIDVVQVDVRRLRRPRSSIRLAQRKKRPSRASASTYRP